MKTPCREAHAQRGLALLEVLIASTIAAAATAMLASGLLSVNRSRDLRVEQVIMGQLLASRLAALDDPLPDDAPSEGAFDEPLDAFHWRMQRESASVDPQLETVILTVSHGTVDRHVVTYRQHPEPPAP